MSVKIRQSITADSITYEQYAQAIDILASGQSFEQAGILGDFFKKIFSPLKKVFEHVKENVGMGVEQFAAAFKAKNVFQLMKAIKFNLNLLFKGVMAASALVNKGLMKVFGAISKTDTFQKLREGVVKIDEVLERWPILKKVTGIALAGLLFWIWLNQSFIGRVDADFDMSTIGYALMGDYSLTDLFASEDGLAMLVLLGSGMLGLSFPWLGHNIANLIVAIAYTGYKQLRDRGQLQRLKALIPPLKRV